MGSARNASGDDCQRASSCPDLRTACPEEGMSAFLLHILGYDLWFYWTHRWMHATALGWSFHRHHHTVMSPTWKDTYTGHWAEGPVQSLGFCLPWLLGIWSPWSTLAAAFVCQARGLARHDGRTTWLIGNHHLLHHRLVGVNYGEYWMDRLWGTADTRPELREHGWIRI